MSPVGTWHVINAIPADPCAASQTLSEQISITADGAKYVASGADGVKANPVTVVCDPSGCVLDATFEGRQDQLKIDDKGRVSGGGIIMRSDAMNTCATSYTSIGTGPRS